MRRSVSSRARAAAAALLVVAPLIAVALPATAHATAAADCRPVPAPAADILRATEATGRFGVDGTGVTVGVISGSFAAKGQDAVDADIAAGWLPGPANPCGWTTPVEVLDDPNVHEDDEGRAMAQVVHGIAPGARILFAGSAAHNDALATAIDDLREHGADIIVDDLGLDDDLLYERGAAADAIGRAVADDVLYVTAAGNYGRIGAAGYPSAGYPVSGWATTAYRPMTCPAEIESAALATSTPGTLVDCLDFDPGATADATQTMTVEPGSLALFDLHWGEPSGGVSTRLGIAQKTTDQPLAFAWALDPDLPKQRGGLDALTSTTPVSSEVSVVRQITPEAATPPLAFVFADPLPIMAIGALEYYRSTETDTVGASMIGHPGDPAALAVAAVDADTRTLELFSSAGPVTTLFGVDEPVTVEGPAVAGIDGVPISFPLLAGSPSVFSGTSAAAPTVAAVAALVRQAAPDADVAQVRAALTDTARPDAFTSPWPAELPPARVSGAGLVDAVAAVGELAPPTPTPSPTATVSPSASPTPAASPSGPPGRLAESGTTADATALAAGVVLATLGLGILVGRRRRRHP